MTGTNVWAEGRELSESEVREMDARIERVIASQHHGRPEASAVGLVDPKDVAARRADVMRGRADDKDGHWRQVMEHWGFNWLEPRQLDATIGPQRYIPQTIASQAGELIHDHLGRPIANSNLYWTKPHAEGQWRSDVGSRRPPRELLSGGAMAFTMTDLVDMFGEPSRFDSWARERIRRHRLARAKLKGG